VRPQNCIFRKLMYAIRCICRKNAGLNLSLSGVSQIDVRTEQVRKLDLSVVCF